MFLLRQWVIDFDALDSIMPTKPVIPKSVESRVIETSPIGEKELDAASKYQAAMDKSQKLRALLAAWENQHKEERAMRKQYAKWLLGAMISQLALVNVTVFLVGNGTLTFDPWVVKIFIVSVFGEVAAMTFWVVKFLFPKMSSDVLGVLEKM